MLPNHLIPSPNALSSINVYYHSDFLSEKDASQIVQSGTASQASRRRDGVQSLSRPALTQVATRRPGSAKISGTASARFLDAEATGAVARDTETMILDLKFLRASLMDTSGNLLLRDGANDKSSTTYRQIEKMTRKRPSSTGTDHRLNAYKFREAQFLKSDDFYELLPEGQRGLLDKKMHVDFSLLLDEKAQKALDTSISYINKGMDLGLKPHGMDEDILSAYNRRRPRSAHLASTDKLLLPSEASGTWGQVKTVSRPSSVRKNSHVRDEDLKDRLQTLVTSSARSTQCFGDVYNSITQGNAPATLDSLMGQTGSTGTLDKEHFMTTVVFPTVQAAADDPEVEIQGPAVETDQKTGSVSGDVAICSGTNDERASVLTSLPLPLSAMTDSGADKSQNVGNVSKAVPIPIPRAVPQDEHQIGGYSHSHLQIAEGTDSDISNSSIKHTGSVVQSDTGTQGSTTDELTVDSDGNMYVVLGNKKDERSSPPPLTAAKEEEGRKDSEHPLSVPVLVVEDAMPIETHGEVILDEEVFGTVSQHSTQSSALESSLNANLTRRNRSRRRAAAKYQQKRSSQPLTNSLSDASTRAEEPNFRQLLHTDRRFPSTFQPKTMHVAASHSTLDISEGPIEIKRLRKVPHTTERSVKVTNSAQSYSIRPPDKVIHDFSESDISTRRTQSSAQTSDSTKLYSRRVIVPERQGFKGSVITSYHKLNADNKDLRDRESRSSVKNSKPEHTVDLKKVYGGLGIDKGSFSMDASTPLMMVKATVPSTSVQIQPKVSQQDPLLEGSIEAIEPTDKFTKERAHPTPLLCSQIDTYPVQSLEYSVHKEDMEEVVDLSDNSSTSHQPSISCLVNSQLQRSDLETSLVIPKMEALKYLERSADLLGSMIGEPSNYSDEASHHGKIVLSRSGGYGNRASGDELRPTSVTDHTSHEQSWSDKIHEFREMVKQELSQQSQLQHSLQYSLQHSQHSQRASLSAGAPRQSVTFKPQVGVEDLPPQTFINTAVIPLQHRIDNAIASARQKKPICTDESDTLANYIDICDSDDRESTPTIESAYLRVETPRPSDFSVVTEHISYSGAHGTENVAAKNIAESAEAITATNNHVQAEEFAVSRSDTQRPCVDVNTEGSHNGSQEPRLTMVHMPTSLSPSVTKVATEQQERRSERRSSHFVAAPTDDTSPAREKQLYNTLQSSAYNDVYNETHIETHTEACTKAYNDIYNDNYTLIPNNYEPKQVLDYYELDANFPILNETDGDLDPTEEIAVMTANYKKLAMDAAQQRHQQQKLRFELDPACGLNDSMGSDESLLMSELGDVDESLRTSTVTKADETDTQASKARTSSKSSTKAKPRTIDGSNWRSFVGRGSSLVDSSQGYPRWSGSSTVSGTPRASQTKKAYNKYEHFTQQQFLPVTSGSSVFKADHGRESRGTRGSLDSTPITNLHATLPIGLPIELEAVRSQFEDTVKCAKSLLRTKDLESSNIFSDSYLNESQSGAAGLEASFRARPWGSSVPASPCAASLNTHTSAAPSQAKTKVKLQFSHNPAISTATDVLQGDLSAKSMPAPQLARSNSRIKSAAVYDLIKCFTTMTKETASNLAKAGYSKARLESSSSNVQARGSQKRSDMLEKAAQLLEKPRQKAAASFSNIQSDALSESMHVNHSAQEETSEFYANKGSAARKGSSFISASLAQSGSKSAREHRELKLLSSHATYEAHTTRVGNSTKIRTRTLHPDGPVPLRPSTALVCTPRNSVIATVEQAISVKSVNPTDSSVGISRPGKMARLSDTRLGQKSQGLLRSTAASNINSCSGGLDSRLLQSAVGATVVTPSPMTKSMAQQIHKASQKAENASAKNQSSKTVAGDRKTSADLAPRASTSVLSPSASRSILSKRPRSAIVTTIRDSLSRSNHNYGMDSIDSSSGIQLPHAAAPELEPLSIMARALAVQSPERIMNDPYDVQGTLRNKADRFIACRGFRVSSAGKLRLPTTIEKDIVTNLKMIDSNNRQVPKLINKPASARPASKMEVMKTKKPKID